MNKSSADLHNEMVTEFVMKIGREATSFAEIMVIVESFLLATMLVNARVHKCPPAVAAGLAEAAIHSAIERFAKMEVRP